MLGALNPTDHQNLPVAESLRRGTIEAPLNRKLHEQQVLRDASTLQAVPIRLLIIIR